jgi:hypothetical protein
MCWQRPIKQQLAQHATHILQLLRWHGPGTFFAYGWSEGASRVQELRSFEVACAGTYKAQQHRELLPAVEAARCNIARDNDGTRKTCK